MEIVIGILAALIGLMFWRDRSRHREILSLRSQYVQLQDLKETERSEAHIRVLQKEVDSAEKDRLEASERYRNANSFPPNDPTRPR